MNSLNSSSIDASQGALQSAATVSEYEPPVLRLLGNAHDLLAGPGSTVCDFGPSDLGAGLIGDIEACQ